MWLEVDGLGCGVGLITTESFWAMDWNGCVWDCRNLRLVNRMSRCVCGRCAFVRSSLVVSVR